MDSLAATNEVLVSETLRDLLLGSAFVFEDRGEHDLKGLSGARRVYATSQHSGATARWPRDPDRSRAAP